MANEEHVALLKQGMDASVAWPCIMAPTVISTVSPLTPQNQEAPKPLRWL
jgi:hypothetical protein